MSKTTLQPGPPQMTTTVDNPLCNCCTPPQVLEQPTNASGDYWVCPITGQHYIYDPGEGVARQVTNLAQEEVQQTQTTTTGRPAQSMYPQEPKEKPVQIHITDPWG